MQVEGRGSRFLGSSNWTGGNKDRRGESEGYTRMANTKVHQEHAKIPGIGKLLLIIH